MKLPIAIVVLFVVAACSTLWCLNGQVPQINSRLTSDATQTRWGLPMAPIPNSALFVPPSDMIHVKFFTNTVPLVVRVEVSSNVWRRTVWWQAGQPQTNEALMASNLISVVTNEVAR